MKKLAFVAAVAFLALLAPSQQTVKPTGQGSATYQEGSTTTGKFTCDANGLAAGVDFSSRGRTDESLIFTVGGTNDNATDVEYYRVWKNRFREGMAPTNDYYLFQQDPDNPKKFTWKKYWCAGFKPNGTPYGSVLTGEGSVTYP